MLGLSLFDAQKRMSELEDLNERFRERMDEQDFQGKEARLFADQYRKQAQSLAAELKTVTEREKALHTRLQKREDTVTTLQGATAGYADVIKVTKLISARYKEEAESSEARFVMAKEREGALRRRLELAEESVAATVKRAEAAESARIATEQSVSKLLDDRDRASAEREALRTQWEQMVVAMKGRDDVMASMAAGAIATEGELKATALQLAGAGAREEALRDDLVAETKRAADASKQAAIANTTLAKRTAELDAARADLDVQHDLVARLETKVASGAETIAQLTRAGERSAAELAETRQAHKSAVARGEELQAEVRSMQLVQRELEVADVKERKQREATTEREAVRADNARARADGALQEMRLKVQHHEAADSVTSGKMRGLEVTRDSLLDRVHLMQMNVERAEHDKNKAEAAAATRGPDGGLAALTEAVKERDVEIDRLKATVRELEAGVIRTESANLALQSKIAALEREAGGLRTELERAVAVEGREANRADKADTAGHMTLLRLNQTRLDLERMTSQLAAAKKEKAKLSARADLEGGRADIARAEAGHSIAGAVIDRDAAILEAADLRKDAVEAREEAVREAYRVTLAREKLAVAERSLGERTATIATLRREGALAAAKVRALSESNSTLKRQLQANTAAITRLKAAQLTSTNPAPPPLLSAEGQADAARTDLLLEEAIDAGADALCRAIVAEEETGLWSALLGQLDAQLRAAVPARTIRYHLPDSVVTHPPRPSREAVHAVEVARGRRSDMTSTRLKANEAQFRGRWRGALPGLKRVSRGGSGAGRDGG